MLGTLEMVKLVCRLDSSLVERHKRRTVDASVLGGKTVRVGPEGDGITRVRTGRREADLVLVVKRVDERTLVVIEALGGHIVHAATVDQNRQCGCEV